MEDVNLSRSPEISVKDFYEIEKTSQFVNPFSIVWLHWINLNNFHISTFFLDFFFKSLLSVDKFLILFDFITNLIFLGCITIPRSIASRLSWNSGITPRTQSNSSILYFSWYFLWFWMCRWGLIFIIIHVESYSNHWFHLDINFLELYYYCLFYHIISISADTSHGSECVVSLSLSLSHSFLFPFLFLPFFLLWGLNEFNLNIIILSVNFFPFLRLNYSGCCWTYLSPMYRPLWSCCCCPVCDPSRSLYIIRSCSSSLFVSPFLLFVFSSIFILHSSFDSNQSHLILLFLFCYSFFTFSLSFSSFLSCFD